MTKALSLDLRVRVVAAVERDGLSRRQAAARFGIGVSTAVKWLRRWRESGSVAPGRPGGRRPKTIRGAHAEWLAQHCCDGDFSLRGLVAELGGRGLKVDYRSVWAFVHAEKLSYKKSRCSPPSSVAPTSRAGAGNG